MTTATAPTADQLAELTPDALEKLVEQAKAKRSLRPDLEGVEREAAATDGERRLVVTWASEYEMRNVRWLWDKRIPLGMLSGLYGVEGMGKSQETERIAAGLTRGSLPGALEGEPRRVLIATTEDGWQETVSPRLKAAGADMSMVGHVRIKSGDADEGLALPRDADLLGRYATARDVALLVLDPVLSHLDGRADSHKTKDVRKALEPLHRAAETSGFGVLGIMHFNKEKGTDTRMRGQASSAFREVFRSTLVVGPDPDYPDDKTRCVIALDKNNLVPPQPSYRMRIEAVTLEETDPETGEPIHTSRIAMGEECSYTAEELLEAAAGAKPKAVSEESDQARLFLRDRIEAGCGATPVKATKQAAEKVGISTTALDKARSRLKLGSRRIEGAEGTAYEWYDRAAAGEELEF